MNVKCLLYAIFLVHCNCKHTSFFLSYIFLYLKTLTKALRGKVKVKEFVKSMTTCFRIDTRIVRYENVLNIIWLCGGFSYTWSNILVILYVTCKCMYTYIYNIYTIKILFSWCRVLWCNMTQYGIYAWNMYTHIVCVILYLFCEFFLQYSRFKKNDYIILIYINTENILNVSVKIQ